MRERAINPLKLNTRQTHHQDNNTTIARLVRPKRSRDVRSHARAWSRGDFVSHHNKGSHRMFDMSEGGPSLRRLDALFAFSPRWVLDLGNGV